MTTSNAKIIEQENKENAARRITVSSADRTGCAAAFRAEKSLRMQKLAGAAVIVAALAAVFLGGELSAAAVMIPPALAAVFSKEKLLDFNIFGSGTAAGKQN